MTYRKYLGTIEFEVYYEADDTNTDEEERVEELTNEFQFVMEHERVQEAIRQTMVERTGFDTERGPIFSMDNVEEDEDDEE